MVKERQGKRVIKDERETENKGRQRKTEKQVERRKSDRTKKGKRTRKREQEI